MKIAITGNTRSSAATVKKKPPVVIRCIRKQQIPMTIVTSQLWRRKAPPVHR